MLNIKMVNNQIVKVQEANFDLKKIEDRISVMSYKGNGLIKDLEVEHSRLPSIAGIFYEKIFLREIPSPDTLYNEYINKYFKIESNGKCRLISDNKVYNEEGVKARVFRTYPSLLRDFHFYILCYDSKLFDKVEYSFLTDIKEGIDLMIEYKGVNFAISLFVDTKRSKEYKKKKYKRHDYSNFKEICIAINPFDRKNYIGDYALYRKHHIQEMLLEMNKEFNEGNDLQVN